MCQNPEEIDLSKYKSLTRVSFFDSEEICNSDYLVEEVNGRLYRIEYEINRDNRLFVIINVGLAVFFLMSVGVLLYIGRTVIRPFNRMSDMTVSLAKGNLSTPVKEEKSRFFGKFLWGVDMLRENLENTKTKNLEYQKEKKTMLLSLSHDIKTPLSAIQLYTKYMQEGIYETEKEKQEALIGIMSKTEEIKAYVDEIHRVSREEFMEFDVHPGAVYMSQVMDSIGVYYSDKLGVLHTKFIMDEYEDCLLSGDKDRLIEVLQNLMENAIKYGDGKEIRISFSEEEECKLITVSNSGCLLEGKELANLFDSFYRGSNTDGIQGNGLGLYIVKQLMKRMDGDAFAEIEDDRFKITVVVRKA
ncbi:MAG: HAMP domain-containing histidine kinase [Eubacterium sp.]|nr:HAMP domain-containing histidine kinase [Eubacterium sp.]